MSASRVAELEKELRDYKELYELEKETNELNDMKIKELNLMNDQDRRNFELERARLRSDIRRLEAEKDRSKDNDAASNALRVHVHGLEREVKALTERVRIAENMTTKLEDTCRAKDFEYAELQKDYELCLARCNALELQQQHDSLSNSVLSLNSDADENVTKANSHGDQNSRTEISNSNDHPTPVPSPPVPSSGASSNNASQENRQPADFVQKLNQQLNKRLHSASEDDDLDKTPPGWLHSHAALPVLKDVDLNLAVSYCESHPGDIDALLRFADMVRTIRGVERSSSNAVDEKPLSITPSSTPKTQRRAPSAASSTGSTPSRIPRAVQAGMDSLMNYRERRKRTTDLVAPVPKPPTPIPGTAKRLKPTTTLSAMKTTEPRATRRAPATGEVMLFIVNGGGYYEVEDVTVDVPPNSTVKYAVCDAMVQRGLRVSELSCALVVRGYYPESRVEVDLDHVFDTSHKHFAFLLGNGLKMIRAFGLNVAAFGSCVFAHIPNLILSQGAVGNLPEMGETDREIVVVTLQVEIFEETQIFDVPVARNARVVEVIFRFLAAIKGGQYAFFESIRKRSADYPELDVQITNMSTRVEHGATYTVYIEKCERRFMTLEVYNENNKRIRTRTVLPNIAAPYTAAFSPIIVREAAIDETTVRMIRPDLYRVTEKNTVPGEYFSRLTVVYSNGALIMRSISTSPFMMVMDMLRLVGVTEDETKCQVYRAPHPDAQDTRRRPNIDLSCDHVIPGSIYVAVIDFPTDSQLSFEDVFIKPHLNV